MFPKVYCLHNTNDAPKAFELDESVHCDNGECAYVCKLDETEKDPINQFLIFTDGPWPDEALTKVNIHLNSKDNKLCTLTKSQRCFLWSKDNCKEGYQLCVNNQITISALLQGAFVSTKTSDITALSSTLPSSTTEGELMQKANETTPVAQVQSTPNSKQNNKKMNSNSSKETRTPTKNLRNQEQKSTPSSTNGCSKRSKKRQLDKENLSLPTTPKLKSARCKGGSKIFGHEKMSESKQVLSLSPIKAASKFSTSSDSVSKIVRCVQLPARVPKPSNRWGHSMCMVDDKTAVLIGGQGNKMQLSKDSVWALDTESRAWKSSTVMTDGIKPENRTGHSATYDPTMRCIYVFGGSKNSKWFHDVHMYDLDNQKWTLVKVNGKAPTRAYHSATLYRHELWIFGGVFPRPNLQPDGCDNELHIFSPVMEGWYKPIVTGDKPLPRSGHSATLIEDRLFVFGGWDFPFCYNDAHILDLTTLDWSSPPILGEPPKPRCWSASSALTNSRVFIHGGYDGDNPLADAFIFDLDTYTWQTLTLDKAPSPRAGHAGIRLCSNYESRNEDEIIIFGGGDNDGNFFSDMLSFYVPFVPALSD